MSETLTNASTLLSIISSSIIIIASLIGGFWAYHTYINNENKAGLSLRTSEINHTIKNDSTYYLNLIINVRNIGNRELDLLLKQTSIKIFKTSDKQLKNIEIKKDPIYSISGRFTHHSNLNNSRMRSGVDYNFPYSIIVDKPGRYFYEFSITADMNKYKSFFSRITTSEIDPITWQEKGFYIIPKTKKSKS